jgi:hypothetical protein
MDDTLGNPLTIEMSQQIDQVEVLKQEGAILPNPLVLLRVCYGAPVGRGVDRLLPVLESRSRLIVGSHDCSFDTREEYAESGFNKRIR